MKTIILASGSPQRKKLLKHFGLKFQIQTADVEEKMTITSNCASLVKYNAQLKAQKVAENVKSGIVIGADTVVYLGGKKLLGKPKNLVDARQQLKVLFQRPQWVYTGVAVIDQPSGKMILDYEKTKVFMRPLSDDEIKRYHKKVPPLDKAGSFDIEGWGSIFIERIEGCYSNVIGLPMSKLAVMLKKVGVSVLSLMCVFTLWGCHSEFNLATGQTESLMYSTDREVAIGTKVAEKIEAQYDVLLDVDVNERANRVLDKIVDVSDRSDIVYFIKILDDEMLNAISLPGGYIYIFKGLMDKIETDDQLAGIVAHEVGHVTARHAVKRLQASYGAMLLQIVSAQAGGNVAGGVGFALTSIFVGHSQADEHQADKLAVKYMKKAGYDAAQMIDVLQVLQDEYYKQPIRQYSYWRTHPNIAKRMAVVNKEVHGKIGFKDYLNLTEEQ